MEPVAVLVGTGTFCAVLGAAVFLRRLPAGRTCPECATPTTAVKAGLWLRLVRPRVHQRWCSGCGWTGLRRSRAPVGPADEPPAHESGFHWARPEASEAPLFVWRGDGRRSRGRNGRGHHGENGRGHSAESDPDQGPGVGRAGDRGQPAHPSGFRWKNQPADDAPLFLWGDQDDAPAEADGQEQAGD